MADKTEAAQTKINTATELGIIIESQELVMLPSHIHDHAMLREYAPMQYNTAIRKRDKAWINHFLQGCGICDESCGHRQVSTFIRWLEKVCTT